MAKRTLKRKIKQAYPIPQSKRKCSFLRAEAGCFQPRMSRWSFYRTQLEYIRPRVWLLSIAIMAFAFVVAYYLKEQMPEMLRGKALLACISAVMPILAVSMVVELNRSLIYGMNEIEMGARYNLTEVYYARTLILGASNLLLILIAIPFVARESQVAIFLLVIYLLTPFLLTVALALEVAAKCGREGLQITAAVSAILVSACYLLLINRVNLYRGTYEWIWITLFFLLDYAAFREWRNTKKNLEARICS